MALDTACSSSLVAIHQAALGLDRGEADLALAGGVHVIVPGRLSELRGNVGAGWAVQDLRRCRDRTQRRASTYRRAEMAAGKGSSRSTPASSTTSGPS